MMSSSEPAHLRWGPTSTLPFLSPFATTFPNVTVHTPRRAGEADVAQPGWRITYCARCTCSRRPGWRGDESSARKRRRKGCESLRCKASLPKEGKEIVSNKKGRVDLGWGADPGKVGLTSGRRQACFSAKSRQRIHHDEDTSFLIVSSHGDTSLT